MADHPLRKLDYATWIRELERDTRELVTVERPSPDRAIVRLNTFTTKSHQDAIRALLAGTEKAIRGEP